MESGNTDLLIMSAGPYRHYSCLSAYCVDAQEMADAVGMTCWGTDDKIRYFSQILYHGNLKWKTHTTVNEKADIKI